jgi:hypothetical protein
LLCTGVVNMERHCLFPRGLVQIRAVCSTNSVTSGEEDVCILRNEALNPDLHGLCFSADSTFASLCFFSIVVVLTNILEYFICIKSMYLLTRIQKDKD